VTGWLFEGTYARRHLHQRRDTTAAVREPHTADLTQPAAA
jgi:hypothetical protein